MQASTNEVPRHPTPGRWVGGLVGVVVCVITGLATAVIGYGFLSPSSLVPIVIGGLPIALLGGYALLPAARSGGWLEAFAVGLIFGMIAPPLGAMEVILVALLPSWGRTTGFDVGYLGLLPIALLFSYVAAVMTVPAGLLWALIARAIPEKVLRSVDLGHDHPGDCQSRIPG